MTIYINSSSGIALSAGSAAITLQGGQIFDQNGTAITGADYGYIQVGGDVAGNIAGIVLGGSGGLSYIHVGTTGSVEGGIAGFSLSGDCVIVNDGSILGFNQAIHLSINANISLENRGVITAGTLPFFTAGVAYAGLGGVDTVHNSGHISGNVVLGSGNDFYDGRGGDVIGLIDGGNGDDVLVGGAATDMLKDDVGNNWLVGGAGDDTITIGNYNTGVSIAFGGEAGGGPDTSLNDTLGVDGSASTIALNGNYVVDTASNKIVAWIQGFENVVATSQNDTIIGTAGSNVIDGYSGADWLVGNGGNDRFVFNFASQSGSTVADFSKDIIDLHGIDAISTTASDDAFSLVLSHTNNTAGQCVFTNYGSGGVVQLYTNADNIVDCTIYVAYANGAVAPIANDFIL